MCACVGGGIIGCAGGGYSGICATCARKCISECVISTSRHKWQTCLCKCVSVYLCARVCICVCMCVSTSCNGVESEGDQTVSQLPWEGSSGCDRVEEAKYPGSNTLLCLSRNEAASPGSDNTRKMFRHMARVRRRVETSPWPEEGEHVRGAFTPDLVSIPGLFLH